MLERNEGVDVPFVHIPICGVRNLDYGELGEDIVPPSQAEELEIAPVNHENPVLDHAPRASQREEEEIISKHLDQRYFVDLPHRGYVMPVERLLDSQERVEIDGDDFLNAFPTPPRPPSEASQND